METSLEHRRAICGIMNARPVTENSELQKFKRGDIVKIGDLTRTNISNFMITKKAIVEYTYAQKFGGKDHKDYSLILIDDDFNIISSCAWFHEDTLTLVDNANEDSIKACELYEKKA